MADAPTQPIPTSPSPAPAPAEHIAAEKIHVLVRNRQKILFEEDAKSVTSKNDTGTFDVLPEHANFITLINQSVTIRTLDGEEKIFELKNGIMKVKDNTVHCFMDLLTGEPAKK